jgi:hypothetical protein
MFGTPSKAKEKGMSRLCLNGDERWSYYRLEVYNTKSCARILQNTLEQKAGEKKKKKRSL